MNPQDEDEPDNLRTYLVTTIQMFELIRKLNLYFPHGTQHIVEELLPFLPRYVVANGIYRAVKDRDEWAKKHLDSGIKD